LATNRRVGEQTTSTMTNWQQHVRQLLRSASSINSVALVGVGHPLRGDDYVGSQIVKTLTEHLESELPDGLHIFDAEDDVEAVTTRLADLAPRHVIFIDACEMKLKPGETQLLPIEETSYPFFTTHGIPLKVLVEQLLPKSQAWVLAIQPKQIEFSEELSPEVHESSLSVSRFLIRTLEEEESSVAD
jgi:hydrogenase 3 maturation protease